MKNILIILIILTVLDCTAQNCVELFEKQIGKDNAKNLTDIVNEFDSHIIPIFNNNSYSDNFREYIKLRKNSLYFLDTINYQRIKKKLINYNFEDNFTNSHYIYSPFLAALYHANQCSNSARISEYLDAKKAVGDLSLKMFSEGVIRTFKDEDYQDYFLKRILIVETFMWGFYADVILGKWSTCGSDSGYSEFYITNNYVCFLDSSTNIKTYKIFSLNPFEISSELDTSRIVINSMNEILLINNKKSIELTRLTENMDSAEDWKTNYKQRLINSNNCEE